MAQTTPQTILGGVDYSGIPGSELTRVILAGSASVEREFFFNHASGEWERRS